jgi:hypothetical protein
MTLIRLIEMCFNGTYNEVLIDKHLSLAFPIQIGRKKGDALSLFLLSFALEYAIRNVQESHMGLKVRHISSWSMLMV